MSSFKDLLNRLSIVCEAKGLKSGRSLAKDLPEYLRDPYKQVYTTAQEKGTTAPREARIYIVDLIASLVSKKLGRDLTTNEFEKGLRKLYNVANSDAFLKYLETNKPEDTEETYSELLSGLSLQDVEESEGEQAISKEEKLQQQIMMRPSSKNYDVKALDRELMRQERELAKEKKKELKELEKAAHNAGNTELANTFNNIDDIVTKTAEQIGVDVETQVDPETKGYARFAKGIQQSKDVGLDTETLDISLMGRLTSPENIAKVLRAFNTLKGVTAEKMSGKPGVTVELPVGMIKSADDANTQVERLFAKLFPGVDIENVDVEFYGSSEDAEDHHDWRPESIEEYEPDYDEVMDNSDDEEIVNIVGYPHIVRYGSSGEVVSVTTKEPGSKIDVNLVNRYLNSGFDLIRAIAAATSHPNDADQGEDKIMMGESYTSIYLTEQTKKDSVYKPKKTQNQSFRDRYKPKTSWQLEELRRYGM